MLIIHRHLENGSKQPALVSGATFLLSPSPICVSFGFFQFSIRSWLLSGDWLAHLSADKVPEDNTRIHAHLSKGTHMQTQTCTVRHLTCTKLHTQEGKPYVYTHTSSRIQSPPALGLPNLHLINPYASLTKQERALNSLWTLKLVA